jgi:hypothetical protein
MSVIRFIGWMLVLAGGGLALRDVIGALLDHGGFRPIPFGAMVSWLRLNVLVDTVEQIFDLYLFDPLGTWINQIWAFAVLIAAGGLLLGFAAPFLDGRRRR